jgi:hypothetical protein
MPPYLKSSRSRSIRQSVKSSEVDDEEKCPERAVQGESQQVSKKFLIKSESEEERGEQPKKASKRKVAAQPDCEEPMEEAREEPQEAGLSKNKAPLQSKSQSQSESESELEREEASPVPKAKSKSKLKPKSIKEKVNLNM